MVSTGYLVLGVGVWAGGGAGSICQEDYSHLGQLMRETIRVKGREDETFRPIK